MDTEELLKELKDIYEFLDVTYYKKDDGCPHLEFLLTPEQVERYGDFSEQIKNEIYACELHYGGKTIGDGILGTTNVQFKEPNILIIEGHITIIKMIIKYLFLTNNILFNKGF